jgi:hypothetical protein
MPNFTYTVDRSNPACLDVVLKTDTGAKAGDVMVVWPEDRDTVNGVVKVGPYSVKVHMQGQKLSYALLWVGLTLVEQAGYTKMKTGVVHGVLHDTMARAGLTRRETAIDPKGKSEKGKSSRYLENEALDADSAAVWGTDDIPGAKRQCELQMSGRGITITEPVLAQGRSPLKCGTCTIL